MFTDERIERPRSVSARESLRAAAMLLLTGQLLYIVITQFHTGGPANDHPVIFAKYAASGDWKAVHAGQFLAMAVMVAGLVALSYALNARSGGAALTARLGAVSAGVALALYAGLQAVDGVGNKEVDAAWVHAGAAQKAAAFASADTMRWLEWGMRSYHDYALGLSLLLVAGAALAARAATVPRGVAYLMGLTGVAYLAQGWVVGADGFTGTDSILIVAAWALSLAWMIWLAVGARRMPTLQTAAPSLAGRT
jgi:hypothetical protein